MASTPECSICLNMLKAEKSPRFLECHHSFCEDCLEKYCGFSVHSRSRRVSCPKCKQFTILPTNGVSGLPLNFYISDVICKVHQKEKTNFCNDCKQAICEKCEVQTHSRHETKKGNFKRKIAKMLIEQAITSVSQDLDNIKEEINKKEEMCISDIEGAAEKVYLETKQVELNLKKKIEQDYIVQRNHIDKAVDTVRNVGAKAMELVEAEEEANIS